MRAIAGPGHVSNEFVDYDAVTNPNGTVVTADWANDVQDELIGIQDYAGIAEAAGTNEYVLSAIKRISKEYGRNVGDLFYNEGLTGPVAFDEDNPATYFPALALSDIDEFEDIAVANWPDLVPWARDRRTAYKLPGATAVDSWAVTVSGSDITFPAGTSDGAVLAALVEDNEYQQRAGGVSWAHAPTVNIDGTDYAITGINLGTSVVTVSGSPSTGAQTGIFYTHRVAGSSTTARMFEATGAAIHSPGDDDGLFVVGRRLRGHFQGFQMRLRDNQALNNTVASAGGGSGFMLLRDANSGAEGSGYWLTDKFQSDGTNGTPRVTSETHSPALVAHLYIHGGRYVA
jgi:hypothetical protein